MKRFLLSATLTALPIYQLSAAPAILPDIETLAETTQPSTSSGAGWTPPGTLAVMVDKKISGRQILTATPAVKIPNGSGALVDRATLSEAQVRDLLSTQEENVTVESIDQGGNISSVYGGVTGKKGSYRVTYYYYRFTMQPCAKGAPADGGIAIGVGLRVTAEIKTTEKSVNVSGILPLSAAANDNRASGNVKIEAIGLNSGQASITSYLSGASALTADGLKKAIESFGVIKAVYDVGSLKLTPNYVFVESTDVTKCLADFAKS